MAGRLIQWLFAHNHLRDDWKAISRCALNASIFRAAPRGGTRNTKANYQK